MFNPEANLGQETLENLCRFLAKVRDFNDIHQDVVTVETQQGITIEEERTDRTDKHHAQGQLVQQAWLTEPPDIGSQRGNKHLDIHTCSANGNTMPFIG